METFQACPHSYEKERETRKYQFCSFRKIFQSGESNIIFWNRFMITVSIFFAGLRGNKKYQIPNRRKLMNWVVENVGASIDKKKKIYRGL